MYATQLSGEQPFSLQEKNRNSNLAKTPTCPSDIKFIINREIGKLLKDKDDRHFDAMATVR